MKDEQVETRAGTFRGAMGGLSLLLLVAVALQASPGLTERAVPGSERHHGPVVRLIAEAVTRRAERQVRRLDERPVVVQSHPVVTVGVGGARALDCLDERPVVARLSPWLTDLPPPVMG